MTTMHILPAKAAALFDDIRDEIRTRHEAHVAHRQLRRELAAYTTPAQIDDLLVALDRSDAPETREVRHILAAQRVDYFRAHAS
ncbi:MAG: hypothetical protein U0R80_20230 [Nocardioidaceae bacterium]